jgi:hypothetical protein
MMSLLALAIGFLLLAVNAEALTFTTGAPGTTGTNIVDQFKVTFNDGTTATLTVPITSGLTDIGKADKIAMAVTNSTRDGAKVTLPAKVTKFEQTVNQSGEKGTVASLFPGTGSVGFNLPLTGLTQTGTPSTFQASLGFSLASVNVLAASNIPFSNLTSPTLMACSQTPSPSFVPTFHSCFNPA